MTNVDAFTSAMKEACVEAITNDEVEVKVTLKSVAEAYAAFKLILQVLHATNQLDLPKTEASEDKSLIELRNGSAIRILVDRSE